MSVPPPVDISGVTVTAPDWGSGSSWDYVDPSSSPFSSASFGPGGFQLPTPEQTAALFALQHVTVDSTIDQSDPKTQQLITDARNAIANLYYAASQMDGSDKFVSKPGGGVYTASDELDALQHITINFTSSPVIDGAATVPTSLDPASATYQININPSEVGDYPFSNPEASASYVIYHELGHANAASLSFDLAHGYGTATADNKLIEAYANTMGAYLAGAVYAPYPTEAELSHYSGTIPMSQISGTSGADTLVGSDMPTLFTGGEGVDTVSFASANGVTANLTEPDAYSWNSNAFSSIESLQGPSQAEEADDERRFRLPGRLSRDDGGQPERRPNQRAICSHLP